MHINIPIFIVQNFFEFNDEIFERTLGNSILEYVANAIVFTGVNFILKYIIERFVKYKKLSTMKKINEKQIIEKQEQIVIKKKEHLNTIEILRGNADQNHNNELVKKEKGLIIHLALYGKFSKLEKYKKDFDYLSFKIRNARSKNSDISTEEFSVGIKIKEFKIDEECETIENEIIDVTLLVRSRISNTPPNIYSSILFWETTKTLLFGFFNPIYKTDDIPYILIM